MFAPKINMYTGKAKFLDQKSEYFMLTLRLLYEVFD